MRHCKTCGRPGHYAPTCPQKPQQLQQAIKSVGTSSIIGKNNSQEKLVGECKVAREKYLQKKLDLIELILKTSPTISEYQKKKQSEEVEVVAE